MASSHSSNKSRRKNNNRRNNSSVKKKRSSRQMKNKNVKKKINIPVQQVEKEGPRVIQLNDDSKTESNRGVKDLQSPGEPDVNFADNIHASKCDPPANGKPSDVYKKQSNDNNSIPSAMKLDGKDNTDVASSGPVEQGGDGSTPKRIKIGSIEQCSGLNTLDDDLVFREEDLIFIDESAEQHRFDVRDTDDQYIHEMKISTMPNPFDTKLAWHNMAVQMYKYANEIPDVQCGQVSR
ncbi:Uncharacterized protein Fot_05389 [Forsythia ovata]|uniref:Uncharacterized protein n=1 Tax=Forsythia ovata TaxID=205694 RepID=A0ABD1WQL6_9LAMI